MPGSTCAHGVYARAQLREIDAMKKLAALALSFATVAVTIGCEEPAANKFCKGADGTVQDCGIACDTTKKEDVCKLYESKTKELCDKVGKKDCQAMCDAKNEHACAHVKAMK